MNPSESPSESPTETNVYEAPQAEDYVKPTGPLKPVPTIAGLLLWIVWLLLVLGVIVYFVG